MLGKRDLESVSSMYSYFDHNQNFIDYNGGRPVHPVKINQADLGMSSLSLRLGMLDKALMSVLETIRIS